MKVILTDGTELKPVIVTGEKRYIQGVNRDALTFVFTEASLDEMDSIFTAENCEHINIVGDDESEAIYNGYVIRVEITKKAVEKEDGNRENRVFVSMAQRSEAETKAIEMQAFYDAVMEEVGV